jgi:hypothetical protein
MMSIMTIKMPNDLQNYIHIQVGMLYWLPQDALVACFLFDVRLRIILVSDYPGASKSHHVLSRSPFSTAAPVLLTETVRFTGTPCSESKACAMAEWFEVPLRVWTQRNGIEHISSHRSVLLTFGTAISRIVIIRLPV